MGKRGGLFFVVAAIVMSAIIWGNPITYIQSAFFPEVPVIHPTPQSLAAVDLSIDASQLMAHVRAIAQPRNTPVQKATARQYITEQLRTAGLSPREQPYNHPETDSPETGGINIVADIPGLRREAGTFILAAHYDTAVDSPGADDNASAIAALLEAARLLPPSSLPATLRLVFFDQEEGQPDGSGLLGSLAYTENPANLVGVKGAVVLDMIGYACRIEGCQRYPAGIPAQNLPETGEFLAVLGLAEHTELIGAFMGSAQNNWPLVLSLPIPERTLNLFPDLLRSDHAPFWEQDIPAVFVTDTANFRNTNYHTVRDTPDTLAVSFFRGSAQHVVNATATLLSQPISQSEQLEATIKLPAVAPSPNTQRRSYRQYLAEWAE